MKDMTRWLGDGGMPIIDAIGGRFTDYGVEDDLGWVSGRWVPTPLACNPHGIVQAGVHAVKTETMRVAKSGDRLVLQGKVVRLARQVAYCEARVTDAKGNLVSRATGTFLLHREI